MSSGTDRHSVQHRVARRRLGVLALVLLGLAGLALAWSQSPLRHWLDVDLLVSQLRSLGHGLGPWAAIAGFGLALTLAVPLTPLVLVSVLAFGPWVGAVYAVCGALGGAALSYGAGSFLGRAAMQRLGGARLNAVSQRLAQRGLLAVIAVRMVPVAPFAIINMLAGTSHIRLRDLLAGTVIGMAPSTLVIMLFMEPILAALKQPSPLSVLLLGGGLALILVGGWGMRRWLRQATQNLEAKPCSKS